jgi:hypothetical protein
LNSQLRTVSRFIVGSGYNSCRTCRTCPQRRRIDMVHGLSRDTPDVQPSG